jgi:hypothetical protein
VTEGVLLELLRDVLRRLAEVVSELEAGANDVAYGIAADGELELEAALARLGRPA